MDVTEHTYADGYRTQLLHVKARQPIGNCFIFHGMLEHHQRYVEFADFLSEIGFNVFLCDLRGAGSLARTQSTYAHLSPHEGFDQMVDDAISLLDHYQDELPTVVLGHSFGSLLARRLGQQLGHRLAGVIAVSPPPHSGLIGRAGLYAIDLAIRFKGSTHESRLFERLLFGRYNLKFLPATTESDWISSVPEEVTAYMNDPDCGGIPTLGYLHEVAKASLDVTSAARIQEHPKTLPILFVVGADDPVVHDGEGLSGIVRKHQAADIELTVLSYDQARHEVLRERQRQDIWTDIGDWMHQTIRIAKRTSIS
ncbi:MULTISPECIES: alpha/beta fold hydrolase [Exiguobacterium]|uniref:Serine aminopeptidase S33 domain-containing protein n=1 Tax=Exiguobacterium chiriqhucha RW-2 TaxID=1345023 RepID=U1MW08_9BACL|nr:MULTISPECIES: alpha/beta fold hydrolase [Exiguobacterium]ERG66106.1 hypothetical protein M467_02385 [Exiguobacterium chiriqhucha RW-2]